jgi:H/ACA ribonucleoprotein complex non-core subunit NAF1
LGFISNPSEQSATNEPSQPTVAATQEQHATAEVIKPENGEATVETNGQQEGSGDAMEVDQKPVPATQEDTNGATTEQQNNESQEQEEEHPEWEIDSDPYESSSDSSSSDDSSDSDDEDYPILSPEEQARILMLAEGGSDDEGGDKGKSGGKIRSTNEVEEDVLPIPDVQITPEMKIVLLGRVQTAIDNAVLIEASTSGEYQVLESGSLLCSEDRKVLGVVSETLGRVENPLYTVMYKSAEDAQERGMVKDMLVYYVEAHSTFVFTQPLKGLKGSDASNFHDEEVAEDEIEFSDDEAEAEYKRKLKQKRQERKEAKEGGPARGKKAPPGPSKLSQTELNYDDGAAEDGYTPLARPKNLHEMMGAREAPVEGTERGAPGFRGGRGRGRGADRGGRGGRGRGGGGRGGSWDRDQDHRPHHQQSSSTSQYGQQAAPQQAQPPAPYGQPAYQQQQAAYGIPQSFAGYPQYPQQQQQPQFGQGQAPAPFPFQFPFQQPFAQPNPLQAVPPGAHINPLFLAALQQQQQQQYQQPQQQYQQPQQAPGQQPQTPAVMNFDQVKAQLDLLRQLSNGNQGPPPS